MNSDEVLQSTLDAVGKGEELSASLSRERPSDLDSLDPKNVLTIRRFDRAGERSEHSNLGDSRGKFIWEPLTYNNPNNIRKGTPSSLRYIVFREKK